MKRTVRIVSGDGQTTILRRRPVKQSSLLKLAKQVGSQPSPFYHAAIALDMDYSKLANICGVSLVNAVELCSLRNDQLGDLEPECQALLDYVNERIGMYVALRNELMAKLARDRATRLSRRAETRGGT